MLFIIESSYEDRQHENRRTQRHRLERLIEQKLRDSGIVLISAFCIVRTQDLLYKLEEIIRVKLNRSPAPAGASLVMKNVSNHELEGSDWLKRPIILDSPLASGFTVYRKVLHFWNQDSLKRVKFSYRPLDFERLIIFCSHAGHLRMAERTLLAARPANVIAGHGICSSGRIANLKAMLGDLKHKCYSSFVRLGAWQATR